MQNVSYENVFDLHECGSTEEVNFRKNGFAERLVLIRKQKAKMIFKAPHPLRAYAISKHYLVYCFVRLGYHLLWTSPEGL